MADINEDIKNRLREFLELDDNIRLADGRLKDIKDDMKTVKERHKELGEMIKEFMKKTGREELITDKGVIKMKEAKRVAPLNKDDLATMLKDRVGDKAVEIAEEIWNNRKKTSSFVLKRTTAD
jgi:aminoglycoside phosphotransferase family enzyme